MVNFLLTGAGIFLFSPGPNAYTIPDLRAEHGGFTMPGKRKELPGPSAGVCMYPRTPDIHTYSGYAYPRTPDIHTYPGYSYVPRISIRTPDIHTLIPRICIPSYPRYSHHRTPDILTVLSLSGYSNLVPPDISTSFLEN